MPKISKQHHSSLKKKITVHNNGGHIVALFKQTDKKFTVLQGYPVVILLVTRASNDSLSTNQCSAVSVTPPFWYQYYWLGTPTEGSKTVWYFGTIYNF